MTCSSANTYNYLLCEGKSAPLPTFTCAAVFVGVAIVQCSVVAPMTHVLSPRLADSSMFVAIEMGCPVEFAISHERTLSTHCLLVFSICHSIRCVALSDCPWLVCSAERASWSARFNRGQGRVANLLVAALWLCIALVRAHLRGRGDA